MSVNSPNMNLIVSSVGTDSGRMWEQNLNASLYSIDGHNHTPGKGVAIPPSGLDMNAPLPFNGNPITSLGAAVFTPQASYATLYGIYSIGNDLYFNDGAGNVVRITSGGTVNATSSGITSGTASASFVSSVLVVNAASNTPANIKGGSVLIGNNVASSKYLTLAPPAAMAADFGLVLPSLPAATSFLELDTSGNITAGPAISLGIDTANIKAQAVTAAKIANNTITGSQVSNTASITAAQITAPALGTGIVTSYANTTTSYTQVVSFSAGLSTVLLGRPILIVAKAFTGGNITMSNSTGAAVQTEIKITKQAGGATIYDGIFATTIATGVSQQVSIPPSLSLVDVIDSTDVSNGSITYVVSAKVTTASSQIAMTNIAFQSLAF